MQPPGDTIVVVDQVGPVARPTHPYDDQKPGTSGLRKKVSLFKQPSYIENFIQAYFNSLTSATLNAYCTLLVGGDGRYLSREAIAVICQVACANGVSELHIAKDMIMSTPACSEYIRARHQAKADCLGGILLTASHNPGGEHEDFGIKFNSVNGGPALQDFTNAVFKHSKDIKTVQIVEFNFINYLDLTRPQTVVFNVTKRQIKPNFIVKIVENVQNYIELMKEQFDFVAIRKLLCREDFKMLFDGMYGAAGPYAKVLFGSELKGNVELLHCDPEPSFNGTHPDPNLKCAHHLVEKLGVIPEKHSLYTFGAACDGDADRNMILGSSFFVTPSDSLAVLALHASQFLKRSLKGVARSMPTSGAVDLVAKAKGIHLFETPTGWKYFGNLMDSDLIQLCGEESFGTGSSHIREKDGLWTVLAWLQILAIENTNIPTGSLVGVGDIVKQLWQQFGRNYYSRYDYENCDTAKATQFWTRLSTQVPHELPADMKFTSFSYKDPVDQSVTANQGLIFAWSDGSRIIFRQSGTGSVGMTIRIYFEKYSTDWKNSTADALKEMVTYGLKMSQISEMTGKTEPDVIT